MKLNKNSLGLVKNARPSKVESKGLFGTQDMAGKHNGISLRPSGLVIQKIDINLWPSTLVRTDTDIKLRPIGLARSYKD